jgi:hypothetical protein
VTAPALPALVLTFVLTVAAALATGPSAHHDSHHPAEMTGSERALGRVAAALAQRMEYPK